jgi:cystathionine beta-lyase
MIYNFDSVPDRHLTESMKWRHFDEDVLPLWVADMDFVSPQPVIDALQRRVEHGIFGYPAGTRPDDLPELRQLILERLAERYAWQIQPSDILFQPGVGDAFKIACLGFASPERAVLVLPPVYPPILNAAVTTRVLGRQAALTRGPDGVYTVDFNAFEAALRHPTGLFLLSNPHNPVGRVYRRDELERMAEICLRQEVLICSDEIHCDLLYRGQHHTPIASLDPEIAQKTITLMSTSKTFNVAGLKFSFAIVQNPELRRQYQHAGHGLASWANLMGIVAAEAALRGGGEWLEQVLAYLEANRDFLFEYIRRELPGVSMAVPEGTYLAWLDCRQAGIAGSPCEFFLKEARVALGDGREFGPGGEGFVRLNFASPRSVLVEALERMKAALNKFSF